jgi:glycerol-3-phosphate dehydrogenase
MPQIGPFSWRARQSWIEGLPSGAGKYFDIIVIGGGITGAGVARDAALRGLRVLLLERGDFSSGTSSKSSKLLHGGLRYLESARFRLVAASCRERDLLLKQAPHLIEPVRFVLPNYEHDSLPTMVINMALSLYDLFSRRSGFPRHKKISREEVLRRAPGLNSGGLKAGFVYTDCKVDDSRLTIETLKAAHRLGARVVNYAPVTKLLFDERHQVAGARFCDALTGEEHDVRAKAVLNVTGVYMDQLRRMNVPDAAPSIVPSVGSHIILKRERLPIDDTVVFSSPDRRRMFVVPWGDRRLVGVTDRPYKGDLDAPTLTKAEVDYLLEGLNLAFPNSKFTRADIVGSYSGIRPLLFDQTHPVEMTSDSSREHKIIDDGNGYISMSGGKLTTYREMAEHLVDKIIKQSRLIAYRGTKSRTTEVGLFEEGDFDPKHVLGPHRRILDKLLNENPSWASVVKDKVRLVDLVYACRHEGVVHLSDLLSRRFRFSVWNREECMSIAHSFIGTIAAEMSWTPKQIEEELSRLQRDIDHEKEQP